MKHSLAMALKFMIVVTVTSALAAAQTLPTRTWVSATGSDANACSRIAPCQTFAGALAKTAAGGEINALDPGSYGLIVINKSITIDGAGTLAGITVDAGETAITVDAGIDGVVVLRNLELNGAATGSYGLWLRNAKTVIVEHTRIGDFVVGGILAYRPTPSGDMNLVVRSSTISADGKGIRTVTGNTFVSHSVITGNTGIGLVAEDTGVINADSNVLTFNGVAVKAGSGAAGQGAAMVRLSNNDVYNNRTGFGCGGGVLATANNNRKGANVGGTAATCSPTVVITQQ